MKARLILTVFLLGFFSFPILAGPIGRDKALIIAENFFATEGKTAPRTKYEILERAPATKALDEEPSLFIVNNPNGGFIIIANEDAATPILAYSYDSNLSIDNAPPAFNDWVVALEEGINNLRNCHALPSDMTKAIWDKALIKTKSYTPVEPVIQLETAQWNQTYPYNELCPIIDGQHSYTGCMPTATAIIMRYWQCPAETTNAYVEPYWANDHGGIVNEPFGNGPWTKYGDYTIDYNYEWESMPLTTEEYITDAQVVAVSTLMRDCGMLLRAYYSSSKGTSAAHTEADFLPRKMGFDQGADYIKWSSFQESEWQQRLRNEIQEGRPILFAGFDYYNAGHAFVGDGLDANGYMHMNWGWGGHNNGWYSLEPFGYENETRQPAYFFTLCAWVGLQPDKGTQRHPVPYVDNFLLTSPGITQNHPFEIEFGVALCDNPTNTLKYENPPITLSISHMNESGEIKELCTEPVYVNNYRKVLKSDCIINKRIDDGDYLAVVYRYDEATEWKEARHDVEHCFGILILKEKQSLEEATSVSVTTTKITAKYGARFKESKLLLITTKRGSYITSILDSEGNGIVNIGNSLHIKGNYNIDLFWNGDYVIPDKMQYHIYLSDLLPGRYTITISRHLEEFAFSFEL